MISLFHFIDWIMRLPGELEVQLREEIVQMEMQHAKPYVSVIERLAQAEGEEKGRIEEAIRLLLRLLAHQFGEVPTAMQQRIKSLSLDLAEPLVDTVLTSTSLDEFAKHLPPVEDSKS